MRQAVIDIGSNTVKLLVADVAQGAVSVVAARDAATRLGENAAGSGHLAPVAMERTVAVIEEFATLAREQGASPVWAVATSAVREANNAVAFSAAVRERTGLEVRVISGEHEADLIFRGVASDPRWCQEPILVVDVGGGSAEVIQGCGQTIEQRASLPLGAVRLTERFGDNQFPALCEQLRTSLHPVLAAFERGRRVVGTGGTLVTLARVARNQTDGVVFADAELRRLVMELNSMTLAERRSVPRMPADRADIIVAGGMVYLMALEALGAPEITVSTRNLRYGVLLDGVGTTVDST